ncbi:SHOCT domain-containing protein [Streptomyces lincolnensis]|uniref:SHOCT domain-containing protein n=1 Tax=Streptomyces lincolnensis TaxID=1915 RepID=UPI0035ABDCF3
MYGNRHDMTGWDWIGYATGTVLFWALLITLGVLLYRALTRVPQPPPSDAVPPSEELLAERFARGEIDEEEYRRRLTVLRSDGPRLTKH